jgi:hypothetical protein
MAKTATWPDDDAMRALTVCLALLFTLSAAVTPARAADDRGARVLSFVLLSQPRLPDGTAYRATLERRLAGRLKIDAMEAGDGKVILLRLRGGTLMVGLLDEPLPKGTVDELCTSSWYWPQACAVTAPHRAHALVSILGTDLDRLDAHLLQADAVAALMDGNAIGSYWGASLQPKDAVLRLTANASRELPPAWLWVNFRLSKDPGTGLSLSTQGMDEFGLMEIETQNVNQPAAEVFSLIYGTVQYLISRGPVIEDGDTIGASAALNIRVHHGPSYWRQGVRVYRVVYPAP